MPRIIFAFKRPNRLKRFAHLFFIEKLTHRVSTLILDRRIHLFWF